ncbi:hypothetical protein ACFX19_019169 [Malus domestica]
MAQMPLCCPILSSRLRIHSGSTELEKKGVRCIEKPKKKNKNKKFDEAVSKKKSPATRLHAKESMLMREVLSLYLRKVDKYTIVGETTLDEVRALIMVMLSV